MNYLQLELGQELDNVCILGTKINLAKNLKVHKGLIARKIWQVSDGVFAKLEQIKHLDLLSCFEMLSNEVNVKEDVIDELLNAKINDDLETQKKRKLIELKNACSAKIKSGFYFNDKFYQSDSHDQQNLLETLTDINENNLTEVIYESGLRDGMHIVYDVESWKEIPRAYKTHKQSCIQKLTQLRLQVANAATTEELEAITYEDNIL
jgi:hypothetical protein